MKKYRSSTQTTTDEQGSRPFIQTQWRQRKRNLQKDWEPSLTVPDETMSLRTIVKKHTSGIPISDAKQPIYENEDEFSGGINPKTLDYAEIQELKERNQQQIQKLQSDLQKKAQNEQERKNQEAIGKIVDQRLKAEKDKPSTNIP